MQFKEPRPIPAAEPVFLLGIMQRSGTNFLADLLRLHPDCRAGGVIWEDYLLAYAEPLVEYAHTVYRRWNPRWQVRETLGPEDVLCRDLGDALIAFLNRQVARPEAAGELPETPPKLLLTKTPSVASLQHFFRFFPAAPVVIIVRDGRAVVESGVKSFDWEYEVATRKWADAARTILEFERTHRASERHYRIVRYETVCADIEGELRKLFEFLALDPSRYDYAAARRLPVRGSSEVRAAGDKVHWQGVAKTESFKPTERSSSWGRARHERFNWLAGQALTELGYQPRVFPGQHALWALWNRAHDLKWEARRRLRGKGSG